MAHTQKTVLTPDITIPQALNLLLEGFSTDVEKESQLLFERAVGSMIDSYVFSKKDIRRGYAMFRTINPQDDVEHLWCAQFIIGNLLGMHKIKMPFPQDKRTGLKFIQSGNDAMARIDKRRRSAKEQ